MSINMTEAADKERMGAEGLGDTVHRAFGIVLKPVSSDLIH